MKRSKQKYGPLPSNKLYTKIPKSRRQLVEKYSTRRYNINTKLIHVTPIYLKRKRKLHTLKVKQKAIRASILSKLRSLNGLNVSKFESVSNKVVSSEETTNETNSVDIGAKSEVCDSNNKKTSIEQVTNETNFPQINRSTDKSFSNTFASDHNVSKYESVCENHLPPYETCSNKKSAMPVDCSSKRSSNDDTWKLVSSKFYSYLLECSNPNPNKNNSDSEDPVKLCRKRKRRAWGTTSKKKKMKRENNQLGNNSYYDPYLRNCEDNGLQNVHPEDNIGLIVYMGINRPLYPIIYHNIVTLCGGEDVKITDTWAEFCLSTLVIEPSDLCVKPILMPVVDMKLSSAVSDFNEKCNADFNEVKITKMEKLPTLYEPNKKMNIPLISQNKDVKYSSFQPKSVPTSRKKTLKYSDVICTAKKNCNARRHSNEKIIFNEAYLREHYSDYKPCWVVLKRLQLDEISREPMENKVLKLTPKKLPDDIENKPTLLSILQSRALPAPIKGEGVSANVYTNLGTSTTGELYDSNDSHNPTMCTYDEWVSMDHYFGLQCSRTYGPMIDYLVRNNSLIYFYKMRRMLKFQRKNNKYFRSCWYFRILKSTYEEDDFIDILTESDNNNGPTDNESENRNYLNRFGSPNPLDIMKFSKKTDLFGLTLLKNSNIHEQYPIQFVDCNLLQNLSSTKWIILKLNQDVVNVILKKSYEFQMWFPAVLLFQVMYRADLTKNVVCYASSDMKSDGKLQTGVYGIPGLCNEILLGPFQSPERLYSMQATFKLSSGEEESKDVRIARSICSVNHDYSIKAVWWRPVNTPLEMTSINAAYLNYLFKWQQDTSISRKGKTRIMEILRVHKPTQFVRFEVNEWDLNFVLIHRVDTNFRSCAEMSSSILSKLSLRSCHTFVPRYDGHCRKRRSTTNHSQKHSFLSNKFMVESNAEAEKIRRLEFRKNRDNLKSVVEPNEQNTVCDASLISIVNEAVQAIKKLNQRNNDLLKEKEELLGRRRYFVYQFGLLIKDMDRNSAQYQINKSLLCQLALPRNAKVIDDLYRAQMLKGETKRFKELVKSRTKMSRTLKKSDNSGKILPTSSSIQSKSMLLTSTLSLQARNQPATRIRNNCSSRSNISFGFVENYGFSPRGGLCRRMQDDYVHVTAGATESAKLYEEHNYSSLKKKESFWSLQSREEDPLADTSSVSSHKGSTNTYEQSQQNNVSENVINICVREDGKPIFRLVINQAKKDGVEKRITAEGELRKFIQHILQQMKNNFKENSLPNVKKLPLNHMELLLNLVSDSRNEHSFSKPCDNTQDEYPVLSIHNNKYSCTIQQSLIREHDEEYASCSKIELNLKPYNTTNDICNSDPFHKLEFDEIEIDEYKHVVDSEPATKFVSINSIIDRTRISQHHSRHENNHQNMVGGYPSEIEDPLCVDKPREEDCLIEEEYVENCLPVEEFTPIRKSAQTSSTIMNTLVMNNTQPRRILRTIPVLRKIFESNKKYVPIILPSSYLKKNSIKTRNGVSILVPSKNTVQLSKFQRPINRIRCPSFVPATEVKDHKVSDVETKESAVEANVVCNGKILNFPSSKESDDLPVEEPSRTSSTESAQSLTLRDTAIDSGNESDVSVPLRLSVKSFASLNSFSDGMNSNVDRLLKF